MKNLFATLLLLAYTSLSANKPSENKSLNLNGEYIAEKNIKCEIFIIYPDNKSELKKTIASHKYFSIKLEPSKSYLLKFKSRSGKTKYLYIPETIPGEFILDVDFSNSNSAILKYDRIFKKLKLKKIKNNKIPLCE